MRPDVVEFFDPVTYTYSYVIIDPATQHCAIVDSVLDYDPASGRTSHASVDRLHDCQEEGQAQGQGDEDEVIHRCHGELQA